MFYFQRLVLLSDNFRYYTRKAGEILGVSQKLGEKRSSKRILEQLGVVWTLEDDGRCTKQGGTNGTYHVVPNMPRIVKT